MTCLSLWCLAHVFYLACTRHIYYYYAHLANAFSIVAAHFIITAGDIYSIIHPVVTELSLPPLYIHSSLHMLRLAYIDDTWVNSELALSAYMSLLPHDISIA